MGMFLAFSLLPAFVFFLGIKALTPAGIDVGGRKLSKTASIAIGLLAIVLAVGTIAFLFAFLILRLF